MDAPVSFRRVASYSELVVCLDTFEEADIQSLDEPRCGRAPPIAPKGCRSESLDGIQKNGIPVVTTG